MAPSLLRGASLLRGGRRLLPMRVFQAQREVLNIDALLKIHI